MYTLQVFYARRADPAHAEDLTSAPVVLKRISELLEQHPDCQQIVAWSDATRLFAVDCKGNRIGD